MSIPVIKELQAKRQSFDCPKGYKESNSAPRRGLSKY